MPQHPCSLGFIERVAAGLDRVTGQRGLFSIFYTVIAGSQLTAKNFAG
jgi:hypothetical protein